MADPDDPLRDFERERRTIVGGLWFSTVAVAAAILFVSHALAKDQPTGWYLTGYMLLIAAACFGAAALLGFLFGVPRDPTKSASAAATGAATGTADQKAGTVVATTPVGATFAWNSNLVEVSDWLTKILLGVGLTQLLEIPHHIKRASDWLARGLKGMILDSALAAWPDLGSTAIACIIVFYACVGFAMGYLVTQLWLYRAFTLAWRTTNSDGGASPNIPIPQNPQNPRANEGAAAVAQGSSTSPATPPSSTATSTAPSATRSLLNIAGVIASAAGRSTPTPSVALDAVARGSDSANDGDYVTAAAFFRIAAHDEPTNTSHWLNLGRALIGARRNDAAIEALENGFKLAEVTKGEAEQAEFASSIMLAGLYTGGAHLDRVLELGRRFKETNAPPRALINRFLACACGQKYDIVPPEQREALRDEARDAIVRDLNSLTGKDRDDEREFLRGTLDPEAEDNDLSSLAEDPAIRQALGLS